MKTIPHQEQRSSPPDSIDIINAYRKKVPVPVEKLAIELGLEVIEKPLDHAISGLIKRVDGNRYVIQVNANQSANRKRFTIAHELGHYILHRAVLGDEVKDGIAFRANGHTGNPAIGSEEETAANRFAANLLMPAETIIELEEQGLDDAEIAKKLGVSREAYSVRRNRPK